LLVTPAPAHQTHTHRWGKALKVNQLNSLCLITGNKLNHGQWLLDKMTIFPCNLSNNYNTFANSDFCTEQKKITKMF